MGFLAVPTPRGLLMLMLAASAAAVAFMNSGLLTAFTASLLGAVVISSFIMTQCSLAGVRITRTFPQYGTCGDKFQIAFTVENCLPLFRQGSTVTEILPFAFPHECAFDIPALAPKEKKTFIFSVSAEQRGEFFLEKFSWFSGDPLGLFRKKKNFRQPEHILVYPRDLALQTMMLTDKRSGFSDLDGRPLGKAGKGMEFFGIRPYRQGDEMRSIHWRSTAAKGKLMVKESEDAAVDQIVIILDTSKKSISFEPRDNNFEFLIACANSIAVYLSSRNCRLRFIAASGKNDIINISGDADSVQQRIRHTLTGLECSDQKICDILSKTAESIQSGSHVCLLTMSHKNITQYIRMMEEERCGCFWLWAPSDQFPPIEKDTPRIIRKKDLRQIFGDVDCLPFVADFTSGAEIIENRSNDEKD